MYFDRKISYTCRNPRKNSHENGQRSIHKDTIIQYYFCIAETLVHNLNVCPYEISKICVVIIVFKQWCTK